MLAPAIPSLADSIVVGNLQSFLSTSTVLAPGDPLRRSVRLLRSLNFDQAPVIEAGHPTGYVLLRDLERGRGTVRSVMKSILPHALTSDLAPIGDVLPSLVVNGFLFVLSGTRISGFVVPSDLNRQAGRAYFYLATTAFELELAELVRDVQRRRDSLKLLPPAAAGAVRKRLAERTSANVEADVVAEMTLSQLCCVVGRDDGALAAVGFGDHERWSQFWQPVNELRKRVAHPSRPLYEHPSEFPPLAGAARQATDLAQLLEHGRTAR